MKNASDSSSSMIGETWEKFAVVSGVLGMISALFLPMINVPLAGGITLLNAADLAELIGESAAPMYAVLLGLIVGSSLLIAGGLKEYKYTIVGAAIQSLTVGGVVVYMISEGLIGGELASAGIGLYGLVIAAIIGVASLF